MITDAVSTQPWPGEAVVEVSIVNWIREPADLPTAFVLDEAPVEGIDTALEASTIPLADVPVIAANRRQGVPGLPPRREVRRVDRRGRCASRTRSDAYATGREALSQRQRHHRHCRSAADTLRHRLRRRCRSRRRCAIPSRSTWSARRRRWHARRARATDATRAGGSSCGRARTSARAVHGLDRFIAGTATGKRILFIWCEPDWRPSNATNVFALETDYAMGVLTSRIHTDWAAKNSSTLAAGHPLHAQQCVRDVPMAAGDARQRERIAQASRDLLAHAVHAVCRARHRPDHALQPARRRRFRRAAIAPPRTRPRRSRRVRMAARLSSTTCASATAACTSSTPVIVAGDFAYEPF